MALDEISIPPAYTMAWPAIVAIKDLGGSATNDEITRKVAEVLSLSEQQQAVPHGDGSRSEIEYRLAWARTMLKNIGALQNSARGVWSLTELGREMSEATVLDGYKTWQRAMASQRIARTEGTDTEFEQIDEDTPTDEAAAETWQDTLLGALLDMDPRAFERLFVRVLREAGFVNVHTTRASGDEGIDGTGVYTLSLISFPVYFQCKRWKGSVGSQEIRNFRGAMVGRADHALFVTTSSFTASAQAEASRAGAPPIDLIDGLRLCDLLKDYGLGVVATPRTVFDIRVDSGFFLDV